MCMLLVHYATTLSYRPICYFNEAVTDRSVISMRRFLLYSQPLHDRNYFAAKFLSSISNVCMNALSDTHKVKRKRLAVFTITWLEKGSVGEDGIPFSRKCMKMHTDLPTSIMLLKHAFCVYRGK